MGLRDINILAPWLKGQPPAEASWEVQLSTRPVLHIRRTPELLQQSIKELQSILFELGLLEHCSGRFDHYTRLAVEAFQKQNGLKVDGIVGPLTWAKLIYPTLSQRTSASQKEELFIQALQKILVEEKFLFQCTGEFDRQTDKALRRFQRYYGLRPDGVCGPITWTMLLGQRPVPAASIWPLSRLTYQVERIVEQVLIIFAVWAGVLWNPLGIEQEELSLLAGLVLAYGLTVAGPLILEKLLPQCLVNEHQPLLRYAPYVLVGLLWRPILKAVTAILS